jgi:uncharacterized protein (TIGR02145 family)
VLIGTQCWLKENLNIGTRIDGTQNMGNNSTIEKYCQGNLESNCDIYGGLYQWNEMMNYAGPSSNNPSGRQGICPSGWHIPSESEWCQLELFLDPSVVCGSSGWKGTDAGGKLKETGNARWTEPNIGATDEAGFSALPGGNCNGGAGQFAHLGTAGTFWSASEYSAGLYWYRDLFNTQTQIFHGGNDLQVGFSVRCLKDTP